MSAPVHGLKYRCPECGTVNDDSFLTFPNCIQCRENLFKCIYCNHFPGVGNVCPFFRNKALTRADVVPDCEMRQSRLLVGLRPFLARPLGSKLWPYILTSTVFGLIVAAAAMFGTPQPDRTGPELNLVGFASRNALRVGDTTTLRLFITNNGTVPTPPIQVRIPEECFGLAFECVDMDPYVETAISRGHGRYFHFDSIPPNDSLVVRLRLKAIRPGSRPLRADVLCHNETPLRHYERIQIEPARNANKKASVGKA